MPAVRPTDVAIPLIAAAAALLLALITSAGALDWLFATLMWTALLFVARQAWRAWQSARSQRRLADDLQALSAASIARSAVLAERTRLSGDIEIQVRQVMDAVGRRAAAGLVAADPLDDIDAIQGEARRATTELRRQLGLLRGQDDEVPIAPIALPTSPGLRRGDVLIAVAVVVIAVIDQVVWLPMEGRTQTWLSAVLTTLCAAGVIGRRIAPLLTTYALSSLLTLGEVLGQPVQDGFWIVAAIGMLAWTLGTLATTQAGFALVLLTAADLTSRYQSQPDNVLINAVVLAVSATAGAAVGRYRRRRERAIADTARRAGELQNATAEAVHAERRNVARDLHDLVSSAVGLVAVQAGAAEVLWPDDPDGSRAALRVVASTAEQTVAELDRLMPGRPSRQHTMADVIRLVQRMRSAGLDVTMACDDEPSPALVPAIYRLTQETLTNAIKHASGSSVDISVRADETRTIVHVLSTGPATSSEARPGYGLVGLCERVEQLGGTLSAGATKDPPGFAVTAEFPDPRVREVT